MTEFVFAPATKEQAKARIALDGPSGSGKTWSALSIAQGLGRRIAVIDTERGSASKYAGDFKFDTLQMHTYDPRDLVKALSAAAGAGYDVVIVDSLSHFWMGKGGMLEQVDGFTKRSPSGNSFGGWKDARPIEREMIDGLLAYPGHVIVTMRTKTEWVITENNQGKKEPKKIGLKAEQRDGLEYEFDIVGDLDLDHNLVVSKSRMSALADKVITRPTADMGAEILAWLSNGNALPTVEDYIRRVVQATTADEVREVYREVQNRNMGAAPCMRNGQSTTLRQFVVDRGTELGQAPAPPPPAEVERSRPQQPQADEWSTPATEQPRPATDAQVRQIAVLFKEKRGIDSSPAGRELRLRVIAEIVGHPVASSKQLTLREASRVIEVLSAEPDFDPQQYVGQEMVRQHEEASVDLSDASPAAVAEAQRLEGLPGDASVEDVLRDRIESAGDPNGVDRVLVEVGDAVAKKQITNVQRDVLVRAAGQRKDTLTSDAGWSHQRLAEKTGAAA